MPESDSAPAAVDVSIAMSIDSVEASAARPVRARIAVIIAFASNGLLFGAWAPRIPEVKHNLGLNSADLGLALLAPAVGSIIAIRLVGRWSARFGTGPVTRLSAVVCCGLAWLPGLAPNLATLWLALLAWGATMGSVDVAMNAQGVTVEASYGRPVLSGFHAAWSIGTFAGAVIGGFGAGLHVPIAAQQAVVGGLLAIAGVITGRWFLPDPPPSAEALQRAAPRPGIVGARPSGGWCCSGSPGSSRWSARALSPTGAGCCCAIICTCRRARSATGLPRSASR